MRWNESHRASHLPPILHCCLLLSPPLPSVRFPHALSSPRAPYESLFHSGSPTLYSSIYAGSTFLLLSLLSQPSTLFLVPFPASSLPTRIRRDGKPWRAIHTRAHIYTAPKVFARGGQYSPTTRTTPSRTGWNGGERGRTEEIRFYPAAVTETFFPYLGITSKLE